MDKLCPFMFVFALAIQIQGANIMLNKPTMQSSNYSPQSPASLANDGSYSYEPSDTAHEKDPYWQGDLQGFYTVHRIAVTSPNAFIFSNHLRNAFIGVSVHDKSCPDAELTMCGQWPNQDLSEQTLQFQCSHAGPVRFIRIWREVENGGLAISEVEVTGFPTMLLGGVFHDVLLKKVLTPITSLTVSSVAACGTMCHRTQPCLGFSYSSTLQPNCLLATDTAMTSDVKWVGYKIQECFPLATCNFTDFPQ